MVVVLKAGTGKSEVEALADKLTKMGVEVNPVYGKNLTILGLIGDTTRVDPTRVEADPCVEKIIHVAEPFKKANRAFHPDDTVVDVSGVKIGGEALTIIAGPCSVESEEQICQVAGDVKGMGANLLRGGAFKPRTSPYAFQGLKYDGLKLLIEAREKTGMPIVSEIMSPPTSRSSKRKSISSRSARATCRISTSCVSWAAAKSPFSSSADFPQRLRNG